MESINKEIKKHGWYCVSQDKEVHVFPVGFGHEIKKKCWCEPEMTYKDSKTKKCLWVHREIQ